MGYLSNKLIKSPSIIITERPTIEDGLQKVWQDIRNSVNGIKAIGLVSRIGFPISTSFTSQEMDDDKCAAMVASVISVADRLGLEFESLGSFRQSIFTNESGFLLFYDLGTDSILFCILKTESTKLGLINYIIQQKMPIIKSFLDRE
ncbi:MAG: roadblock/LC7 domain-containing protein [Candidatus Hodarchaeales archaeon]|jgi:predicted regulator of Ras-like GTPase activity (Roadblock/LC7/MglB family)